MAGKEKPESPLGSDYGIASLLAHWKHQARVTVVKAADTVSVKDQVIGPESIQSFETVGLPELLNSPEILLQATIVNLGDKTTEGQLVQGVAIPWFEFIRQLERDPEFLFKVPWRKLEELVAGAYEREGWDEVTLTPRSGDRGRDVIATKRGIGSIRIIDQVKRYNLGLRVTADEVRSMLGVLQIDQNVSKGIVTTTSQFAPGIFEDKRLQAFIPHRLELKDGQQLIRWLLGLYRAKQ